jgi:hypothetical protein
MAAPEIKRTLAITRDDGGVSIMRLYDDRPQMMVRALANLAADYARRTPPLVIQATFEIAEADIDPECKRAARQGAKTNFRDCAVFRNGKVEIDMAKARVMAKDFRAERGRGKKDAEIDAAQTVADLKNLVESP